MIRVFPVAAEGKPHYWDDFGQPRANGRTHQGNDLFAPVGTPVLASDSGNLGYYTDGIGGPSFMLTHDDGTRSYGTHLSAYELAPLGTDSRAHRVHVQAGDVVGYVGQGGNAAGTMPHLHFQYWGAGGELLDPYPYLQKAEMRSGKKVSKARDGATIAFFTFLAGLGLYIVTNGDRRR